MKNININEIELSFDETHHTYKGQPLYNKRFKKVMSFHPPGVAAVEDESGAYHIDINGNPIYSRKFLKTYGFYEGAATVVDEKGYFHIDIKGEPIYNKRFAWAGNFQEGRCVVRDFDGTYYHIKKNGKPAYGERYRYVGDFKYGIAVVYDDEGYATHIDRNGKSIHGKKFIELGVYHKGYAIAKDNVGYFHIDKKGNELYSHRFSWVENFYNDFALAKCLDGRIVVIDTSGSIVKEVTDYDSYSVIEAHRKDIMNKLVGYWHTQIIYSIVKLGILEIIDGKAKNDLILKLNLPEKSIDMILDYLLINNMLTESNSKFYLTPKGKMLTEKSKKYKLKYATLVWGEEHYITMAHLINSLISGKAAFPELYGKTFFKYLDENPEKANIYQKAMHEYAVDYTRIIESINIPKWITSIADIGGGHGTLLSKIIEKYPYIKKAYLFDLPNVIKTVKENFKLNEKIKLVEGDFFKEIPLNVDAVILSRVLHDWDDERCTIILNNIKKALNPNGLLFIIETVVPELPKYDLGVSNSFNLLVMVGGKERKLSEFQYLFSQVGLALIKLDKIDGTPLSLMVLQKEVG